MTEKGKQLYQVAEEKFNWINEELQRLNKDYVPEFEEDFDPGLGADSRDETLYNFECLLDSFDDEYLDMFSVSFEDVEFEQETDGEWDCFDPAIILTPEKIPCLDIMIVCAGYYLNGGDGEPCDPTENCHPAAEALVAKYKKQYEETVKICRILNKNVEL